MAAQEKPIFTIGTTAKMLDLHPKTLRHYERENLIRPVRTGSWRYFTMDDIKWIECLRDMIHEKGISLAAIKKLLQYTPCWNIADCPFKKRKQCTAFMANGLVPRRIETQDARQASRCRIIPMRRPEVTMPQHGHASTARKAG